MSSPNAKTEVTLIPITFPDITGKTIKSFLQVVFAAGSVYATGGVYLGLIPYADSNTIDANGFLKAVINGEWPVSPGGTLYTYKYSPIGDVLQIFANGTELSDASAIPAAILSDTLICEAIWDRTTTRG